MSLYTLKGFKMLELKISEEDLCVIINKHFGDENKFCVSIKPTPKKKPTHFVLDLRTPQKEKP